MFKPTLELFPLSSAEDMLHKIIVTQRKSAPTGSLGHENVNGWRVTG